MVGYCPKPVSESVLTKAMVKALETGATEKARTCLPAPAAAWHDKHTPSELRPAGAPARELERTLHILLAESNEVSQVLVTHLLEKRGHRVSIAHDGREVLRTLQGANAREFDMVLMDTEVEGMNGLESARAIRALEGKTGRRLPIIALSAHPTPSEQEACKAAGMDGYLAKPLRAQHLFELIRRVTTPPAATPSPQVSTQPTFDKCCFLSRMEGDERLGNEIIEIFRQEYPKLLESVHRAAEERNASLLERAAHTLKGSVGDMAAPEAFEAARALEQLAREGRLDDAHAALTALEGALNRLMPELHRMEKQA
jgi:CheY-like chemotaxis protein